MAPFIEGTNLLLSPTILKSNFKTNLICNIQNQQIRNLFI
jgi:hypothetical protein